MWWEDRREVDKASFGLGDVREIRRYFYSRFRWLAPDWLDDSTAWRRRNHFTVTWTRRGTYPLAFITYLGKLFEFLESQTDLRGREKLTQKLASLPRLPEDQLQALFTELFVTAQFASQFAPLQLEPMIGHGDRNADFSFHCGGQEVFVDATRLSVTAFSDVEMICRQVSKQAALMCHRQNITRQARIRFSFLPQAHQKDAILKALSSVFSEAVNASVICRTCVVDPGGHIEVEVRQLPVVYGRRPGNDQLEPQPKWCTRLDVDEGIEVGGVFAMQPSVEKEVFVDLLRSSFDRKLKNAVRAKLEQRRRGQPFILAVDLSQIEALGTRLSNDAGEQLLERELGAHPELSAVCLFTRGEPWYQHGQRHHIHMVIKGGPRAAATLPKAFVARWAEGSSRVEGLESFEE